MPTLLNEVEARVLGALAEKQVTTPEYYPLTLNALVAACNQKNNRHPISSLDEATVEEAVESLRQKNLVYVFYGSTSRVPKYKHLMTEILRLSAAELAVMCVLMLRGPQTLGELRERAGRMHEFAGLSEVDETLNSLAAHDPDPLVRRLARQPGQKEARFAHLLSGEPVEPPPPAPHADDAAHARPAAARANEAGRTAQLEGELESLRAEVRRLREEFEEFKSKFE
ncbi:MAG TPA: YceH family protein [Pyrinomonadaceae bacterium]|nr:YceH family protein [Pyrinomonadaceae bacterium]